MTHSHDNPTPSVSAESEEANLRAIIGRSIANDCWFVKLYPFANETAALEARSRVLSMADAPAPNPSPAEKGGEGGAGKPGSVAYFREALSGAKATLAALATPSSQPADALREALIDARNNGLIYWEPNTERGHTSKALMLARIDAALASDPADD